MKYAFLFFLITYNCLSAFSQRSGIMESPYGISVDFQTGYYYKYSDSIVKGFISIDCDCIYFKSALGEKRVRLTTKDLKAFVVGKDSFAILKKFYSDDTYHNESFALIVKKGTLNLYSHCHHPATYQNASSPATRGEIISAVSTYYIQKNNTLYRIKRGDFKDRVDYIFGDNTELMDKINQKKLSFNDLEQIVAEYNAWYEKKNATVTPTE